MRLAHIWGLVLLVMNWEGEWLEHIGLEGLGHVFHFANLEYGMQKYPPVCIELPAEPTSFVAVDVAAAAAAVVAAVVLSLKGPYEGIHINCC